MGLEFADIGLGFELSDIRDLLVLENIGSRIVLDEIGAELVLDPGRDSDAVLEFESEFMIAIELTLELLGAENDTVLGVEIGVGCEIEVGLDIGAGLTVYDADAERELEFCLVTPAELGIESRVDAGAGVCFTSALEMEFDDPKLRDG